MKEGGFIYRLNNLPKQIIAAKEEKIVLQLQDYTSAGYRWHIEQTPAEVIEILGQKLEKPDGIIGTGEVYICFSVRNNGYLRIYLKRDWENELSYDATFTIQCKEE